MHHLARKYQKFPGGACPQTPLAVGAFGTSWCHIRLPLLKILATALITHRRSSANVEKILNVRKV